MEALPSEITGLLLDELTAHELVDYCATSTALRKRCGDSVFWRRLVKRTTPNDLERNWMIQLAVAGDVYLLNALVTAINAEQIELNQWAIVATLFALQLHQEKESNVYRLLAQKIDTTSLKNYMHYRTIDRWVEKYQEALETIVKTPYNISPLPYATEVIISTVVMPFVHATLQTLPSPSILIAKSPYNATNIRDYQIPYLLSIDRLDVITTYLDDLKTLSKNNDMHPHVLFTVTMKIIAMATNEQLHTIFGAELASLYELFDSGEAVLLLTFDRQTFDQLSDRMDPWVPTRGFLVMEPDDWVNWFNTTTYNEEYRALLYRETMRGAKDYGYTRFINTVERVMKKK